MTATNYRKAFTSLRTRISALQRDVLEALAAAGAAGMSHRQLAALLGRKDPVEINGAFGRLGHNVYDELRTHPEGLNEGEFQWWHVLATALESPSGFRWVLRPEVCEALLELGIIQAEVGLGGELVEASEWVVEGAYRQIRVNAYERNPIARRRCIEAHGRACTVCSLHFSSLYGSAAEGYIHVHHLVPLSQIGTEHEVDPANDLRPVCPNCHAVIHLRTPPYSIAEVRGMLRCEVRAV